MENRESYIAAFRNLSVAATVAACEHVRDTWDNTFEAPSPAHIVNAARRYLSLTRSEARTQLAAERFAKMKRERMTPAIIRKELVRCATFPLPDDPFDRQCEIRRRQGLQDILDGKGGWGAAIMDRAMPEAM